MRAEIYESDRLFINSASYRDLLGTAESIIDMDQVMHQVESHLGDLGKTCNARRLEKANLNLRSLDEQPRLRGA